MKKWVLALLVLALFASCNQESDFVTIKVSTRVDNSEEGSRATYTVPEFITDPEMYSSGIKNGTMVLSVTPDIMIADIGQIALYNPKNDESITAGFKNKFIISPPHVELSSTPGNSTYSGLNMIPNRVNLLSTKGMASASVPKSIITQKWNGLLLAIGSRIGQLNTVPGYDGYWNGGVVAIKRSVLVDNGIDPARIVNADDPTQFPEGVTYRDLDEDDDGEYDFVWFELGMLYPYSDTTLPSFMCFQNGFTTTSIFNLEHENGTRLYGCEETTGNAAACVFPMETIDFSGLENPEIVITINSYHLIDFYEQSNGDYYAYLNKNNPFPLRVIVENYRAEVEYIGDFEIEDIKDAAPIDCFKYRRENLQNVPTSTLPNYPDIDHIEIYCSNTDFGNPCDTTLSIEERNKIQQTILTGALKVFQGLENSFIHIVLPGQRDLKYWVCSVDKNGQKSYLRKYAVGTPTSTDF